MLLASETRPSRVASIGRRRPITWQFEAMSGRTIERSWGKVSAANRRGQRRPRRRRSIWPFPSARIFVVTGGLLTFALLSYAVVQSGSTSSGPSSADRALTDESSELPGAFVQPIREQMTKLAPRMTVSI